MKALYKVREKNTRLVHTVANLLVLALIVYKWSFFFFSRSTFVENQIRIARKLSLPDVQEKKDVHSYYTL